jgi:hypothetical protein
MLEVDLWRPDDRAWGRITGILDTGSGLSVIRQDLAETYGYQLGPPRHFWQMIDPSNARDLILTVRFRGREIAHEAVAVPIDARFLRRMTSDEECTRPPVPHPLTDSIILGMSFFVRLDAATRKSILEMERQ